MITFEKTILGLGFFCLIYKNFIFWVLLICFHYDQASAGSKKIVGVFYKANEYAELNPNFLGCEERALGIRDWLESQGHKYIVTDDKEGPDCG